MKNLALCSAAAIVLASTAYAADLPLPVVEQPVLAPIAYDWTGFYVGIHGGYGWGDRDWDGTTFGFPIDDDLFQYDLDGWVLGGQIGANWQFNRFLLGIEADASWSDINGSSTDLGTEVDVDVDWLASIRGRAGFVWRRLLIFGTAGGAFAGVDTDVTGPFGGSDSADETHFGWVAGGGVEVLVTNRWTARVEYLHYGFGDEDFDYDLFGGPADETLGSADLDVDVIRAAVNYKF